MKKIFLISSIVILLVLGCNQESSVEPSNNIPPWLNEKIDSISTNKAYFGTQVYKYKWRSQAVYHILIPVSSCIYCELYHYDGAKIKFDNDSQFQDFLNNKTDQVLVWEWR